MITVFSIIVNTIVATLLLWEKPDGFWSTIAVFFHLLAIIYGVFGLYIKLN